MKLSAVITAHNEEQMLGPCLASLGFTDEIVVVVDSRTTDRTATLARQAGAKVFRRRMDTFAGQKNFGLRKARGQWVLMIDADERVSPELAQTITEAVGPAATPDGPAGYRVPRTEVMFGKPLRHGGISRSHLRLVRRGRARHVGDVHELIEVDGPVDELRGTLWHLTARSIQDVVRKTLQYGELHAAQLYRDNHPPVTARALIGPPVKRVWGQLVVKGGWRDGIPGVIAIVHGGFSLFVTYVMLWQLQRKPSLAETYRQLDRKLTQERPGRSSRKTSRRITPKTSKPAK